ncbi:hypothetical protein H5410_005379 [Solanum commersonii]|uniref:Uncharacterized protein n=1 Tax=Solanum commersonii TaxID=4109 RepID=A0A9J6A6J9_SOLCO|nr:hypothetical protein H5410_005379 [Solanum commersonii]
MLFSLISISSSSVSASDSSTTASSLCTSLVVAGGISGVSGTSKSSAASNKEVKSVDFRYLNSYGESVNRSLEEVSATKIAASIIQGTISLVWSPSRPQAGEGKEASAGIESISTSGDVSTGVALLLSTSSRVYSTSIHRMSVEEEGVTSMSLVSSRDTPARQHNSMVKIGKGKEVCLCLSLMAISCSIKSPKLMVLRDMIAPRQAALGWHRMDLFWDDIMVLLMKPN